jgi:cobalt-precorrin-7 (C5)-methyltransferase
MIVVGVGAGPGLITEQAAAEIKNATLIYGSRRSIDLAKDHISQSCKVSVINDYKMLRSLPERAVVLSTGDPMLSGLGTFGLKVIPGISSLQVACARLQVSQLRVVPLTFHGRRIEPSAVEDELRRGRCVFLLIDESTDLKGLCKLLHDGGMNAGVVVLTNLGYPEETIEKGDLTSPPDHGALSCVMIGDL